MVQKVGITGLYTADSTLSG